MDKPKEFTELEVYKACRAFRMLVSDLGRSFPQVEEYRLNNQMIRASRSVTANLAEGHGRWYHKENIQFCRKSRGSLKEVLEHLIVAYDEKLITSVQLTEYKKQYDTCLKLINGYIKYLKTAKHPKEEDPNNQ